MSSTKNSIHYITDVEGNLEYFKKYIPLTGGALKYHESGQNASLELKEGNTFVYGGDAFDRGPGDIRFSRLMVDLKKKYPDRVYLLIGNRDLNKIKLTSELHPSDVLRKVDDIPKPYWAPNEISLKEYIKKIMKKENLPIPSGLDDYSDDLYKKYHTRTNKLKWMLEHTMGCPKTFEYRRTELATLKNKKSDEITDEDIVDSFYDSVAKPDGFVREYLQHAQIGVCVGNTLFVHGSVNGGNIGFIPSLENKDAVQKPSEIPGVEMKNTHTIQQWIESLNEWAKKGLKEWIEMPTWNEDRTKRGGSYFMGYSYYPAMGERTVIITGYLDNGNPKPITTDAEELLLKSGISRVVVGHKPWGDTPTLIKTSKVEVVTSDQSYSDPKAPDSRGNAVASVSFNGTLDCNSTFVRGYTKDNKWFEYTLPIQDKNGVVESDGDRYIGKELNGWWVKSKLMVEEQTQYLLSKGSEGHKVDYLIVQESQLTTLSNKL